jgi:hypothetical protein
MFKFERLQRYQPVSIARVCWIGAVAADSGYSFKTHCDHPVVGHVKYPPRLSRSGIILDNDF